MKKNQKVKTKLQTKLSRRYSLFYYFLKNLNLWLLILLKNIFFQVFIYCCGFGIENISHFSMSFHQ